MGSWVEHESKVIESRWEESGPRFVIPGLFSFHDSTILNKHLCDWLKFRLTTSMGSSRSLDPQDHQQSSWHSPSFVTTNASVVVKT